MKKNILFVLIVLFAPLSVWAQPVHVESLSLKSDQMDSTQSGASGIQVRIQLGVDQQAYPWQDTQVELCFEILNRVSCEERPWPLLENHIVFEKFLPYRDYNIKSRKQKWELKIQSIKILNQAQIFEKPQVIKIYDHIPDTDTIEVNWPKLYTVTFRGHELKLVSEKIKNLTFTNKNGVTKNQPQIVVIYPYGEKKVFSGHQSSKVCQNADCRVEISSRPFDLSQNDVLYFWIVAKRSEVSRHWLLGDFLNSAFAEQTVLGTVSVSVEDILRQPRFVFSNEFVEHFTLDFELTSKID